MKAFKLFETFLSIFIVAAALSSAVGCGSGTATSSTQVPTNQTVTGNWAIMAASTVHLGSTFPVSVYLTSTQGTVTGVAHLLSSCYGFATNVPLDGTVDASGNIVLTSAAVSNQVLSVTGKSSTGTSLQSGSYSVAGGCGGGDKGTLSGGVVPPLTGTYSGTVHSVSGINIGVVAQLTQTTVPDSNGYLHVAGTAAFSGSPCFSQTTIANATTDTLVLGGAFVTGFTASNPSASIATGGTISADGKTVTIQYSVSGGLCSLDSGSGVLTRQ